MILDWCLHTSVLSHVKCWFVWCFDPHYTAVTLCNLPIYEILFGVRWTVPRPSTHGAALGERSPHPGLSAVRGAHRAPARIQKSRLEMRKARRLKKIVFMKVYGFTLYALLYGITYNKTVYFISHNCALPDSRELPSLTRLHTKAPPPRRRRAPERAPLPAGRAPLPAERAPT